MKQKDVMEAAAQVEATEAAAVKIEKGMTFGGLFVCISTFQIDGKEASYLVVDGWTSADAAGAPSHKFKVSVSAMLEREIETSGAQAGDTIAARCTDEIPSKRGNPMKLYGVKVLAKGKGA